MMEFFGAKFCITIGAWKLRFVLMLEESEDEIAAPPRGQAPHHLHDRRTIKV